MEVREENNETRHSKIRQNNNYNYLSYLDVNFSTIAIIIWRGHGSYELSESASLILDTGSVISTIDIPQHDDSTCNYFTWIGIISVITGSFSMQGRCGFWGERFRRRRGQGAWSGESEGTSDEEADEEGEEGEITMHHFIGS